MMQSGNNNPSQQEIDSLRQVILDQMVSDKLILVEALKDTSIQVTDDQIEQELASKIEELKSRFQNEAEFKAQMSMEGLTLRELKAKFRREVKNQLIKERFVYGFFSNISVTASEVTEYYQENKDALPTQPAAIKLAHILLPLESSDETLDSAFLKAREVKNLLDEGGDFIALAQLYSEDGTASNGGDLGYFERGTLMPEFEDNVFEMNTGEISEPFKTPLGYHIVKIEDKLPDQVRARHILILSKPTETDVTLTRQFADSLRQLILDSIMEFSEVVKQYSIDEETKKLGGEMGWFAMEKLTPEFSEALTGLEVSDISEPTQSDFGFHILKVLEKQDTHKILSLIHI